jgi:hypothetical protein
LEEYLKKREKNLEEVGEMVRVMVGKKEELEAGVVEVEEKVRDKEVKLAKLEANIGKK